MDQLKTFIREYTDISGAGIQLRDLFQTMARSGQFRFSNPGDVAVGGAIIASETGSLGLALSWTTQTLIPLALDRFAGLPAGLQSRLEDGESTLSLAISEPKAGAHPKYLTTTATPVPGGWRLDGEKTFITNGPEASHLAVLAITGEENGQKAYSCFIIPVSSPGVSMVEMPQFTGLHPARHCGFRLQGCEAPSSSLIGRPGKAYHDIALPFRDLEDAVSACSLIAALTHAARRLANTLCDQLTQEEALSLGELAGIESAFEALGTPLVANLREWIFTTGAVGPSIIAVSNLSRRYAAILRELNGKDKSIYRIVQDSEDYLAIARTARQAQKARIGRDYYLNLTIGHDKNE